MSRDDWQPHHQPGWVPGTGPAPQFPPPPPPPPPAMEWTHTATRKAYERLYEAAREVGVQHWEKGDGQCEWNCRGCTFEEVLAVVSRARDGEQ